MINGINIYSILATIGLCVLGYITSYIRTKAALITKAEEFINVAEDNYKSATTAGAQKFSFVVDTLYNYCPAPLRIFITKQMLSDLTQKVFDKMQEYANKQLDKVVDKIVDTKAE